MMPPRSHPHGQRVCPPGEDEIVQSAVLLHVVTLHPVQLTEAELVREIATDPEDLGERDAIKRAVRDLARVGLLHRYGSFVLPTRAALRSYELWQA
jgi:hypothetical protein